MGNRYLALAFQRINTTSVNRPQSGPWMPTIENGTHTSSLKAKIHGEFLRGIGGSVVGIPGYLIPNRAAAFR